MDERHERRELNKGFGDGLARAVEMVVTPLILGAVGWALDARFGTKPFIALGLFAFTIIYVLWKQLSVYDAKMRAEEARILGRGK